MQIHLTASAYAILGMLSVQPSSGSDIRQRIPYSIGNFWPESDRQIDTILKQLETRRLVSHRVEKKQNKSGQTMYALTAEGSKRLKAWLHIPATHESPRNEMLLKLFFGAQTTPAVNREQVQRHRQMRVEMLRIYSETDVLLSRESAREPSLPYWRMTIRYGQLTCEALIHWCDETLKVLDALERKEEKQYKKAALGLISSKSNIHQISVRQKKSHRMPGPA